MSATREVLHRPLTLAIVMGIGAGAAQAATITVTDGGDTGTASTCTLRQAIASANYDRAGASTCAAGSGADNIGFAGALASSTISLGQGPLSVTGPLTINGSGQTIDAIQAARTMYAVSTVLHVSGLTITGGSESIGAGLALAGATAVLTGVTISGNSATTYGGGVVAINGAAVTLTDCTVSGNSATTAGGGVLATLGAAVTLINSTVSGNSAGLNGGGVSVTNSAALTLTNSTVSGNSDIFLAGAGIYAKSGATVTLRNSILSGNQAGPQLGYDFAAVSSSVSVSDSLLGTGSQSTYAGNGNVFSDVPGLSPLADNGGATQTMATLVGSPALDAGNPALALGANSDPLNFDQRGFGFPRTLDGKVDIGAYQHQGNRVFSDGFEPEP